MNIEGRVPGYYRERLERLVGSDSRAIVQTTEQAVEAKLKTFGNMPPPPIYETRFMYESLVDTLLKHYEERK